LLSVRADVGSAVAWDVSGGSAGTAAGGALAVRGRRRAGCAVSVLGWIVFGLVVGVVAKLLMPGRDPGGFVVTIFIGIVGALLGGFLGRVLGLYREGDPVGFVMAVLGSILLLWIYRRTATSTVV
jgi:uncharacterized membrane protein YeaQ/YmgE (transglycosylase-associated protein family)